MTVLSKAGVRRTRLAALALAVLAAAIAVAPSLIAARTDAATPPAWVASWAAMPQLTEPGNMPPAPFTQPGRVMDDTTLRQTVHATLGGDEVRVRFSNAFGG